MLLHERFSEVARRHDAKLAVVFGTHSLTFAQLDELSGNAADSLRSHGVVAGNRVAILLGHCSEAVIYFWGALKAGCTVTMLSEQLPAHSLGLLLEDAKPSVLITNQTFADKRVAGIENQGSVPPIVMPGTDGSDDRDWVARTDSNESGLEADGPIAAIVYTSGSTGKPKGVCLTHLNLATVVDGVVEHMPITDGDSYLMVVPLHYVHGLMQLLVHQLVGATIHFAGGFTFPNQVVKQLQTSGVTGFSGVPYHFAALMDRGGFADTDLSNLRWITSTGGRLPIELISRIRKAKPQLELHVAYGQTECAPRATALHPQRLTAKPESVGCAIPGVGVAVLDEDGDSLPSGEIGEIVVFGRNVMAGYWQQPEATREVVDEEGRLHTGDLGWLDSDGDLFLSGRRNTMLKTAGERIFAEELEEILERHDVVLEAIVIGVPDPLYGDRIEAHVRVPDLPAPEDPKYKEIEKAIRKHCLAVVPFARAPRGYHLWQELPHTSSGKIDRSALRARSQG